MKTHLTICAAFVVLLGGTGFLGAATNTVVQPAPGQTNDVPAPTPFAVTSRDANSSVWERTVYETDAPGQVVARKHSYTELATGLHFWSNGQWKDSKEEIDILPNGTAIATNGQHQVSFPGDIYQGVIDVVLPSGQHQKSRPSFLSYYDGTNNVLIAELTNSIGLVVGSNVVIYPNAFTDFKADIRYTYTKAGIEQDVILRTQIPAPESFGLDSKNTVLEVGTEFFNTADPVQTTLAANPQTGLSDQSLAFGQMKMIRGKAFVIGNSSPARTQSEAVPVYKAWQHAAGRTFLFEDVPVPSIAAQLDQLPLTASAGTAGSSSHLALRKASGTRLLPPARMAQTGTGKVHLASAKMSDQSGLVLDYVEVNTSQTNFTFEGAATYLVDGSLYLYGTTTFEGGTVIKADINGQVNIDSGGTINCQTAAYRPASFTSVNDDAVGETMQNSTDPYYNGNASYGSPYNGNPSYGDVNTFLAINCPNPVLGYMRFSYAQAAITSVANIDIWDSQFVNISNCLATTGINVGMHNVLIKEAAGDYPLYLHGSGNFIGENVTSDGFGSGNGLVHVDNPGTQTVALTNCLVTSGQYASVNGGSFVYSANPVYQTVGAASYYLTNSSPYRAAGTTNVTPYLLAELHRKTTFPPIVYTSTTISTPTTFSPQATRDTNAVPDLGYHYDPLDYVFSGVEAQSNVTFTAGTAISWYDLQWSAGYGIAIDDGATVAFNGTVTSPCWTARYDLSQEGGNGNWKTVGWGFAFTSNGGNNNYTANSPQLVAQFSKFSSRPSDDIAYRDLNGFFVIRANDCEFWNSAGGDYNISVVYSNCLFFRLPPALYDAYNVSGCSFTMVNCTVIGGNGFTLYLQHNGQTWPIKILNCAFDTGVTMDDTSGGDTNLTYCDYNAFLTNGDRLAVFGAHDVTNVLSYNWQSSWLGDYYLPTNSPLINVGSPTADQLGLYHFTTQTNQMKETNSIVDIGYHYVATDAHGNPVDTNGDGIPDYLEDANGNGLADSGEIGWNTLASQGFKVFITRPRNGSTLP